MLQTFILTATMYFGKINVIILLIDGTKKEEIFFI